MAGRRPNHRRSLADPHQLGDVFASGFEVHDFDDWLRLVAWTDTTDDHHTGRRKVASLAMPRTTVLMLMQALRESIGEDRETEH
jgi:hypothetical protein